MRPGRLEFAPGQPDPSPRLGRRRTTPPQRSRGFDRPWSGPGRKWHGFAAKILRCAGSCWSRAWSPPCHCGPPPSDGRQLQTRCGRPAGRITAEAARGPGIHSTALRVAPARTQTATAPWIRTGGAVAAARHQSQHPLGASRAHPAERPRGSCLQSQPPKRLGRPLRPDRDTSGRAATRPTLPQRQRLLPPGQIQGPSACRGSRASCAPRTPATGTQRPLLRSRPCRAMCRRLVLLLRAPLRQRKQLPRAPKPLELAGELKRRRLRAWCGKRRRCCAETPRLLLPPDSVAAPLICPSRPRVAIKALLASPAVVPLGEPPLEGNQVARACCQAARAARRRRTGSLIRPGMRDRGATRGSTGSPATRAPSNACRHTLTHTQ